MIRLLQKMVCVVVEDMDTYSKEEYIYIFKGGFHIPQRQ